MISIFLWSFWNFNSWTPEQTSAFWTAIGAIGTISALSYAFYQNWKNRKKINDLAEINKSILKQNKLILLHYNLNYTAFKKSISPKFHISHLYNPSKTQFYLKLVNLGELATITKVFPRQPYVVKKFDVTIPVKLYGDLTKNFQIETIEDETHLDIEYLDIAGNEYFQRFYSK